MPLIIIVIIIIIRRGKGMLRGMEKHHVIAVKLE